MLECDSAKKRDMEQQPPIFARKVYFFSSKEIMETTRKAAIIGIELAKVSPMCARVSHVDLSLG